MNNIQLCSNRDECFSNLYNNKKLIVICPHKAIALSTGIDRSKIYCSNERLFHYHFAIHARKGFQLLPKFNKIILQLVEAGIPSKWMILQAYEKGLINTNASKITKFKINEKRTFDKVQGDADELISLSFGHVSGACLVLVLGYSSAICAFIMEIRKVKCHSRELI